MIRFQIEKDPRLDHPIDQTEHRRIDILNIINQTKFNTAQGRGSHTRLQFEAMVSKIYIYVDQCYQVSQ
jgi:hypothetical protein